MPETTALPESVNEMNAAAGGATIGPIQPLGVRKDQVEEMLSSDKDLREEHIALFALHAEKAERDAFRLCSEIEDIETMGQLVREGVFRWAVRRRMNEIVRKKDGSWVLYAPNRKSKHKSKPLGKFASKLAAKRAELAKFPPKDPEKRKKLEREIERLANPSKKQPKKEGISRREMELGILARIVREDVRRAVLTEGIFTGSQGKGSDYDNFIGKFRAVADQDPKFQKYQKAIDATSTAALWKFVGDLSNQLSKAGQVKPGKAAKHTDGRTYLPFSIIAGQAEVGPIYAYMDGARTKVEISPTARAALTKVQPEAKAIIDGSLMQLGEGPEEEDPTVAQAIAARDGRVDRIKRMVDKFIVASMKKYGDVFLSVLKHLLVKKYRKQTT